MKKLAVFEWNQIKIKVLCLRSVECISVVGYLKEEISASNESVNLHFFLFTLIFCLAYYVMMIKS